MPTDEEYRKLLRVVKQIRKMVLEDHQAISDLWDKVNADFDTETSLVDEAMEKVERNHRRMNRMEKRLKELE